MTNSLTERREPKELLEQLFSVLKNNCKKMLSGTSGTRCIDSMLDILFKLHTKDQLPDALPLLEEYLKTDKYKNFNQLHPHLLRTVVFKLEEYVEKYNKKFLINLFMNMEEQAITGIYFLQENGKFADNKLMEEFQKYPVFPIVFNELSNTAIIMMLNSKKNNNNINNNTKTPGFSSHRKKYTARRRGANTRGANTRRTNTRGANTRGANTRGATKASKTKRNPTTTIQKKIRFN